MLLCHAVGIGQKPPVQDTPKCLLVNAVTHPHGNAREQAHCEHAQVFS